MPCNRDLLEKYEFTLFSKSSAFSLISLGSIRNNILDFQLAMSMKKSIENGQICNQTTTRERLERFGETRIIYETDGF